jgi:hypothetical protein
LRGRGRRGRAMPDQVLRESGFGETSAYVIHSVNKQVLISVTGLHIWSWWSWSMKSFGFSVALQMKPDTSANLRSNHKRSLPKFSWARNTVRCLWNLADLIGFDDQSDFSNSHERIRNSLSFPEFLILIFQMSSKKLKFVLYVYTFNLYPDISILYV